MDFIDRLLALSEKTGWLPIDIFFFCIFFAVFLSHFVPWCLFYIFRGAFRLVRWFRSRREDM